MDQGFRRGFTAAEKAELWDRWQRGESHGIAGSAGSRSKRSDGRLVNLHRPFISRCRHTVEFVQLLGVDRDWR